METMSGRYWLWSGAGFIVAITRTRVPTTGSQTFRSGDEDFRAQDADKAGRSPVVASVDRQRASTPGWRNR